MNNTYLSESPLQVEPSYWFGDGVPFINYIFLSLIFIFYFAKVNKSIIEQFPCETYSEVQIVCMTSGIINIIANILSLITYPTINDQSCLFIVGYGNYVVQICDNSIFYFGYKALHNNIITNKFSIFCVMYTIVFMSLSWLPIYVILPYVNVDATSEVIQLYVNNGTNIYTYSNILYNAFLTIEFLKIVYYFHHHENNNISQITYTVAVKCIIHCFTSNFAILLLNYYNVNSVATSIIYITILSTSMNILFNFGIVKKVDRVYRTVMSVVYSVKSTNAPNLLHSAHSSANLLLHSGKSAVNDDDIDINIDKTVAEKLTCNFQAMRDGDNNIYVISVAENV